MWASCLKFQHEPGISVELVAIAIAGVRVSIAAGCCLGLLACGSPPAKSKADRPAGGVIGPGPLPAPARTERQASLQVDSASRVLDSLHRQADSFARAVAQRHDSVTKATRRRLGLERAGRAAAVTESDRRWVQAHTEELQQAEVAIPYRYNWVVDTRSGAYYLPECGAARRVPVPARRFLPDHLEPMDSGYWPSREPGCARERDLAAHRESLEPCTGECP